MAGIMAVIKQDNSVYARRVVCSLKEPSTEHRPQESISCCCSELQLARLGLSPIKRWQYVSYATRTMKQMGEDAKRLAAISVNGDYLEDICWSWHRKPSEWRHFHLRWADECYGVAAVAGTCHSRTCVHRTFCCSHGNAFYNRS